MGMGVDRSELIRGVYAAWNRADIDTLVSYYSPDAEIRPLLSDLGGDVYRGHDGVRRWYLDANEPWDRLLAEPEEIVVQGDVVVIDVRVRAHGHHSGMDLDTHMVHVALMEGDRLLRVDGYASEEHARRALGNQWPRAATEPRGRQDGGPGRVAAH